MMVKNTQPFWAYFVVGDIQDKSVSLLPDECHIPVAEHLSKMGGVEQWRLIPPTDPLVVGIGGLAKEEFEALRPKA
jgi:hypothetical protein